MMVYHLHLLAGHVHDGHLSAYLNHRQEGTTVRPASASLLSLPIMERVHLK